MAYKIVNNFVPASMYKYKAPYAMTPQYVTVHNTGNTASARNEVAYMNSNYNYTSYHVAIDDKEAVQAVPFNRNAWHAGDGQGNGNRKSIGIEICYSMDNGYSGSKSARYKKAEENAALYIAHVLHQYGWGMDRLKRHYDWSGKDCPHKMHATGTYQAFRNRVQAHLNALKKGSTAPAKPVTKKPAKKPASKPANKPAKKKGRYETGWHWSGTFTVTANEGIAVYRGNRGLNKKNLVDKASWLNKGDWVNFDHLFYKNGLWWIRFKYAAPGASTAYFFMPVGKRNPKVNFADAKLWGTVSKLNKNEKKSGVTNWKKKGAVK